MSLTDTLSLISAVAAALNTIAVLIYAPSIIRQTQAANLTLITVAKGLRQTALSSVRTHLVDINRLLLDNRELRDLFGLEARDVLGYMFLNDFENLYTQHEEGLLDDDYWSSKVLLIRETVNRDWIKSLWLRQSSTIQPYQKGFICFIDSLLENKSAAAASPNSLLK